MFLFLSKCKIQVSDLLAIALLLAELQERGLIKEVIDGHWMRNHGGSFGNTEEGKYSRTLLLSKSAASFRLNCRI